MSETPAGALLNSAILYSCVAAGSVCGGLARYLVALTIPPDAGFPWATLIVNVTGSFIIGLYVTLAAPGGRFLARDRQRHFVTTGFCGGYTTFSAFSLETFTMWHDGRAELAAINIGGSVLTWLLAVWLGHMLAGRISRTKG